MTCESISNILHVKHLLLIHGIKMHLIMNKKEFRSKACDSNKLFVFVLRILLLIRVTFTAPSLIKHPIQEQYANV
jgi:hypothetical protein